MYELAKLYQFGASGVPMDKTTALYWYELSANYGRYHV